LPIFQRTQKVEGNPGIIDAANSYQSIKQHLRRLAIVILCSCRVIGDQ